MLMVTSRVAPIGNACPLTDVSIKDSLPPGNNDGQANESLPPDTSPYSLFGMGWLRSERARRWVYGVLAVQVAAIVVFAIVYRPFDLSIYLWGGNAVSHGLHLYAVQAKANWFTYPPFAAAVFTPLTFLPPMFVGLVWELATVAAFAWACVLALKLAGYQPSRPAIGALTAAGLFLEPVYHTLFLGQVNVFLVALVLNDVHRAANRRWAGIGTGLAAAIKLTPAIFIALFLLTRRTKAAVIAIATFAAGAGVGFLADPAASKLYWSKLFYDTTRVSATYISNQSPYAALTRVAGGTSHVGAWYLVIAGVLAVVGLATAAILARRNDWLAAFAVTGITSLLVSPISWTHHWVWALPALIVLMRNPSAGVRIATAVTYLLFVTAPMWWTPWTGHVAQYGFHGLTTLVANSFLIAGVAFLAYMAVQTFRPGPVDLYSGMRMPTLPDMPNVPADRLLGAGRPG